MSTPPEQSTTSDTPQTPLDTMREELAFFTSPDYVPSADDLVSIEELRAEITAAETIEAEIAALKERNKKIGKGPAAAELENPNQRIVKVDMGRIGWVASDEEQELMATRHTEGDVTYDFIDLIGMNRTTAEQFSKLEQEGVTDNLMSILHTTTLPSLWRNIKQGRNLRPVSIGGKNPSDVEAEHSLNTSFPAYKEGIHGPQNRALILVLDQQEGIPVFGLAAMYDHEDDQAIHNNLFLKQK